MNMHIVDVVIFDVYKPTRHMAEDWVYKVQPVIVCKIDSPAH